MRTTLLVLLMYMSMNAQSTRPRVRDLGIAVGVLQPGALNAITDVAGVAVGHATLIRGDDIRTGVTAILPHQRNLFQEKVAGAVFVGNAFGKLAGSTQVEELGEIETPILLTSTPNVWGVADALVDYMLALPGNETVRSFWMADGILNVIFAAGPGPIVSIPSGQHGRNGDLIRFPEVPAASLVGFGLLIVPSRHSRGVRRSPSLELSAPWLAVGLTFLNIAIFIVLSVMIVARATLYPKCCLSGRLSFVRIFAARSPAISCCKEIMSTLLRL